MAIKEIINIPDIDANKTLSMLGNNFKFPLEVDKKGRLVVQGEVVKVFLKFKTICGVKLISGTNTNASLPKFK